jgi:DNA-binding MarR family transcriptional regulator
MVTRAVTQLYDDALRPSGLRVTQFSMLETLARLGEANLKQLEDRLAIDQTTLTRSLNRLGRDGLIERVPHPDARIKAVKPTSNGRQALAMARPLWAQAQRAVLQGVGIRAWANAQRHLTRVLGIAVDRRERRRRRRSPRDARKKR